MRAPLATRRGPSIRSGRAQALIWINWARRPVSASAANVKGHNCSMSLKNRPAKLCNNILSRLDMMLHYNILIWLVMPKNDYLL